MSGIVGTGASITFASGFFAQIKSLRWTGYSREALETTHMGTTTAKTFAPGRLVDPGQLEVTINFDANLVPPITSAAETVTVSVPSDDVTNALSTWAASGFMTNFEWGAELEAVQEATATIKFTGPITVTA